MGRQPSLEAKDATARTRAAGRIGRTLRSLRFRSQPWRCRRSACSARRHPYDLQVEREPERTRRVRAMGLARTRAGSWEASSPRKVPTQSPVQSRSIGWPSLQDEMSM